MAEYDDSSSCFSRGWSRDNHVRQWLETTGYDEETRSAGILPVAVGFIR